MTAGANRILAMAAAAVIAASGPLGAAAPALAQSSPRQTLNVQGADIRAFIQDIARTTRPLALRVDRNTSNSSERLSARSLVTVTVPVTRGSTMKVWPVVRAISWMKARMSAPCTLRV